MKTTTCFSIEAVAPCPQCGTPRVGKDYDDDYYIVPGTVRVLGCQEKEVLVEWERTTVERHYQLRAEAYEKAKALAAEPCKCGAPREVHESGNWKANFFIVACARRGPHPTKVMDALEGCPRCCEQHSWPGFAAD
jgi:hypothetical protein